MHKYIEGIQPIPRSNEVIEVGSTIILHLPESGRSDKLFRKTDNNFLSGITVGRELVDEANDWVDRTDRASRVMLDVTSDKWAHMKKGKMAMHEPEGSSGEYFGPEVKDEFEIIEDIRVFHRKKPCSPRFT